MTEEGSWCASQEKRRRGSWPSLAVREGSGGSLHYLELTKNKAGQMNLTPFCDKISWIIEQRTKTLWLWQGNWPNVLIICLKAREENFSDPFATNLICVLFFLPPSIPPWLPVYWQNLNLEVACLSAYVVHLLYVLAWRSQKGKWVVMKKQIGWLGQCHAIISLSEFFL